MPKRFITLPSGKRVSVRAYVTNIRMVQQSPEGTEFKGWEWFPVSREDILRDFSQMVTDHANRGLVIRELSAWRLDKLIREAYAAGKIPVSECRGCNYRFNGYRPHHRRWCHDCGGF